MLSWTLVLSGGAAGVLANGSGYLITGRWFHGFQERTPGTWRPGESWRHYALSMTLRLAACLAIALAYAGLASALPFAGAVPGGRGAGFGVALWAVAILPVVLELALFVNWHPGFVAGLLLDWLLVCALAGGAAGVATGA